MATIVYVPAPGYDSSEKGIINQGNGVSFDIGAALIAGGGQISVDGAVNPGLVSLLDHFPGLIRSGVTPGPVVIPDSIAPVIAHTGTNPQVGDFLARGSDGLFAPQPRSSSTARNVTGTTALAVAAPSGQTFQDTLTGNVTYSAPTGLSSGISCSIDLELIQDNVGSHTVTWFAGITWLPGAAPTLPTGAGTTLLVTLFSPDGGTTWFGSYGGSAAIEPWRAVGASGQPAFQNAWSNMGSPDAPAQFAKTASGIVLVEGEVSHASIAAGFNGSTIFNLPAGYRPLNRLQYHPAVYGGSFGLSQVYVTAAGDVILNYNQFAVTQFSLSPISFRAEQ